MRLRDRLVVLLVCSAVLGLLTTLLGHVIEERIYAPAVAGAVAGLLLTPLVVRYGGGFSDVASIGAAAALIGTLLSTLAYFITLGLHWQAVGYGTVLEYVVMMLRSGVFIVRFLTDFIMGLAALLSAAGLVAVLVVGE